MESYMKSTHTKRFVVEDSITKVTSDGEPHEMMTMIAGLSGLIAAIVILAILVSLISCKKSRSEKHCGKCKLTAHTNTCIEKLPCNTLHSVSFTNSNRSSISTIYTNRTASISENIDGSANITQLSSLPMICSGGNLEGNLNKAFVNSDFNLSDNLNKKKKKAHWSDDLENCAVAKETTIDIEKF